MNNFYLAMHHINHNNSTLYVGKIYLDAKHFESSSYKNSNLMSLKAARKIAKSMLNDEITFNKQYWKLKIGYYNDSSRTN